MASNRRPQLPSNLASSSTVTVDPGRELFEACRNGDLAKVKKLVNAHNVNAKDTSGRKSSPLHFAAGKKEEKPSASTVVTSKKKKKEKGENSGP